MTPARGADPGFITPTVRARLRDAVRHLSPAQMRVARTMSDDPGQVARMTITELARLTDTSTATVVRTAKVLGYEGYPQVRYALAAEAGRSEAVGGDDAPAVADIVAGDDASTILTKLAAFESDQVLTTARLMSPEALEEAARRIAGSRRCYVFGVGASGLVATDLTQKITRIGLLGVAHVEHDAAIVAASLLGPDDVVVAVSHRGETPGTVEPTLRARRAGAYTAAITGSSDSTLARVVDRVLLTSGVEFGPRAAAIGSRASQLLVVDALFVRVTHLTPFAQQALQTTHDVIVKARQHGR